MSYGHDFDGYAINGLSRAHESLPSLETIAIRVVDDIAELRLAGEFSRQARVTVTVMPSRRMLRTRVDGLSPMADPDRTDTRAALRAVFEVASLHNVAGLASGAVPLFTQQVIAVGPDGVPYAALTGTALGDAEPQSGR